MRYRYRYREELFPSLTFRRAYDAFVDAQLEALLRQRSNSRIGARRDRIACSYRVEPASSDCCVLASVLLPVATNVALKGRGGGY